MTQSCKSENCHWKLQWEWLESRSEDEWRDCNFPSAIWCLVFPEIDYCGVRNNFELVYKRKHWRIANRRVQEWRQALALLKYRSFWKQQKFFQIESSNWTLQDSVFCQVSRSFIRGWKQRKISSMSPLFLTPSNPQNLHSRQLFPQRRRCWSQSLLNFMHEFINRKPIAPYLPFTLQLSFKAA